MGLSCDDLILDKMLRGDTLLGARSPSRRCGSHRRCGGSRARPSLRNRPIHLTSSVNTLTQ